MYVSGPQVGAGSGESVRGGEIEIGESARVIVCHAYVHFGGAVARSVRFQRVDPPLEGCSDASEVPWEAVRRAGRSCVGCCGRTV